MLCSYQKAAFSRAEAWLQLRVFWGIGGKGIKKQHLGVKSRVGQRVSRELSIPRVIQAGQGYQVALGCRAACVAPP